MNSANTVDLSDRESMSVAPATKIWFEGYERYRGKGSNLSRMAKTASLALSIAVSSVTAIADPWFLERRRRDAVVTESIYQRAIGRFVTRAEALRIARQILMNAERERVAIAEFEAARGIQWGDEP